MLAVAGLGLEKRRKRERGIERKSRERSKAYSVLPTLQWFLQRPGEICFSPVSAAIRGRSTQTTGPWLVLQGHCVGYLQRQVRTSWCPRGSARGDCRDAKVQGQRKNDPGEERKRLQASAEKARSGWATVERRGESVSEVGDGEGEGGGGGGEVVMIGDGGSGSGSGRLVVEAVTGAGGSSSLLPQSPPPPLPPHDDGPKAA